MLEVLQGEKDKKQKLFQELSEQKEMMDRVESQLVLLMKMSKGLQRLTGYLPPED